MSKKRKSDAGRLDEVGRSMYTTFCSTANSLSQLYSHAMNHQTLSFQAGERHASEKLFQWILRQQEEGLRVTTGDIVAYLQNELEYGAEELPMSSRHSFQQLQQPQTVTHLNTLSAPFSSTPISPTAAIAQGVRSGDCHAKNPVFSGALSSPVHRSLQHYHSVQGANNVVVSPANGFRNNEINYTNQQNMESNSPSTNDRMDMHSDSPHHDFPF